MGCAPSSSTAALLHRNRRRDRPSRPPRARPPRRRRARQRRARWTVGALPTCGLPPTSSACTVSSPRRPPGSVSRSRSSSTTCPPSSGRRSPPKASGPTFRRTRGACAPSATSLPDRYGGGGECPRGGCPDRPSERLPCRIATCAPGRAVLPNSASTARSSAGDVRESNRLSAFSNDGVDGGAHGLGHRARHARVR